MSAKDVLRGGLEAAVAISMVGSPSVARAEGVNVTTSGSSNIVEALWNSDIGQMYVDRFLPSTSADFVRAAAEKIGMQYTGQDYSSLIFDWANQHPELGSPEWLSFLGGLAIFKSETGFTALAVEDGSQKTYEFTTTNVVEVLDWVKQRSRANRDMWWESIVAKILGQEPPTDVGWEKANETFKSISP